MKALITYITLVTLVCMVDGKRVEIPPGKPVPESLDETDIEALLASGSIEREDAAAMEQRQAQLAARDTQADFNAEREKLLAQRRANELASASASGSGEGGTGTGTGAGTGTDGTGAGGTKGASAMTAKPAASKSK